MFRAIKCTIPNDTPHQRDVPSMRFIQVIMEEERRVVELRHKDLKATLEDPNVREANMTTALSAGIVAQGNELFREQRRRKQLRDNNQELRLLKKQLCSAHAFHQLDEQLRENRKLLEEKEVAKKKENAEYAIEREKVNEERRGVALKERYKKLELCKVIQAQMAEKEKERQEMIEQVMRDRADMQKEIQAYNNERDALQRALNESKRATKQEMEEFLRSQLVKEQQKHATKLDENEASLQVTRELNLREELQLAARQKRINAKELIKSQIGKSLIAINEEKRNRENCLLGLLIEERTAKDDLSYQQSQQKQIEHRIEMRADLEIYRNEIERFKQYHKEEDKKDLEAVQEAMMVQRAKRDKEQKEWRTKMDESYKNSIRAMIQEKRQQRAFEAAELKMEFSNSVNSNSEIQQEIDAERLRLLKENDMKIIKYLPLGVLNDNDRVQLGMPPLLQKSAKTTENEKTTEGKKLDGAGDSQH